MKKCNEKFKVLMGILLAPALIALMLALLLPCNHDNYMEIEQEQESDQDAVSEDAFSLNNLGYILYRNMPDCVKTLAHSEVFGEFNKEDSGEELANLEKIDTGSFGNNLVPCVVGGRQYFQCQLVFDTKNFRFTDEEKIRKIEECGYSGFGEQLERVADIVRENTKEHGNNYWEYTIEKYQLSCQGSTFVLDRVSDGGFIMSLEVNLNSCWVPEKFRDLTERVNALGGYYLSASCVGGEVETLTFCKDNSIAEEVDESTDLRENETENRRKYLNNKRLVLMFRQGELVDYYMTTAGCELKLDDEDKKMLELCTGELGKTLPEKETMMSRYLGVHRIYRAK